MQLSLFSPRHFLPEQIDLTDLQDLAGVFGRLEQKLNAADSVAELEHWLEYYGEVNAAIDQVRSLRYIAMTCQTDDAEREKAYLKFVEEIDPWLKPRHFALAQALVDHAGFSQLPGYYRVFQRSVETQVKLFREKNITREIEVAKFCQSYQKISGAMTVTFDGHEQTLARMNRVFEETDRARRQEAWELVAQRRGQDKEKLEEIYDELRQLRAEIATEAGCTDFRDYTFQNYERFYYTPDDCLEFHRSIEQHIVPLARQLHRERKERLGLETLRPWDLAVDPEHNPPLRPFRDGAELLQKTGHIFTRLDPRLAEFYEVMVERELVDLDNRKGKAPGGYQSTLSESRLPFIFMNSVGLQRDVETLFHEAGHAFHTMAAREQRLQSYRSAPIEFCEVASMSMELLAAPHLIEFYGEAEQKRARRDHLEGIIRFFPWMAAVDAFQHWIYTHPRHTPAERRVFWLSLMDRFGGLEDWSGYEEARAHAWHRQLHIFEIPFYYVEYGIAQLGALQLWAKSKHHLAEALDGYLAGLSLGGSQPLPQLFEAAGLKFDFSSATIQPLVQAVQDELKELRR